jgi:hypothetical protein
MHCSLFKFTLALNSALLFWKLFVFELLLGIIKNFLCSMSALLAKIVLLLDARQTLMSFVGKLTYLEPKQFILIIFNLYSLILSH